VRELVNSKRGTGKKLVKKNHDSTQLYGIVVRAPDLGQRGPRFETRARPIFHDLGKVSDY
jgi:hypothetical protein